MPDTGTTPSTQDYMEWKEHGITAKTPQNILFGAGTIHVGLKFVENKWNFAETLIGATNGGSKLKIKPKIKDIDVDGAFVKAKGLTMKVGETAEMEVNFAELKADLMQKSLFAKKGSSTATGYEVLETKPDIESGDYFENFAFVGRTVSKKPIIVIFGTALCTSGFELDAKHEDQASPSITIECYGDVSKDDGLKTLPIKIYYPPEA